MPAMSGHRLSHCRAVAIAAQRRKRIALWLEHLEHLERTPTRTAEEREAKIAALDLLHETRPG